MVHGKRPHHSFDEEVMKSDITTNAIANVAQMLLSALILFFLYRYISQTLGIDKLGVWSVVLATASASRLADLGFGVGVTRFVAQHLVLNQTESASAVVETALITIAFVLAGGLLAFHPVFQSVLNKIFQNAELEQALEILPYALLSLWLSMLATIVQSGLDGCQKMVGRAAIGTVSQVFMLVFVFVWVPSEGLLGLAYAQILQALFLFLISWFYLRSSLKYLSILPFVWKLDVFKNMLSYGANVQLASLSILLFEPLTKAFMAKFGGAEAAGWFEIANQVVLKVRALLVAANQAIVPRVTQLNEQDDEGFKKIYADNIKALIFFAIPLHAMLMAGAGVVSILLLGGFDVNFVAILQIVICAWLVNAFTFPAYFIGLGVGRIGLNTVAHFVIGFVNVVLGLFLGEMFGIFGVVTASAVALCVGSVVLIFIFQKKNNITLRWQALFEMRAIAGVSLLLMFVGLAFPIIGLSSMLDVAILFINLTLTVIVLWLMWRSTFCKNLMESVFARGLNEK